jgi:hypothetical protein
MDLKKNIKPRSGSGFVLELTIKEVLVLVPKIRPGSG